MKKRILALMMALVMVFGLNTTFLAAGSATVDNSQEDATELEVKWDSENPWTVKFKRMEDAIIYYVNLYNDEDELIESNSIYGSGITDEFMSCDFSEVITENDSYYVTVKTNGGDYSGTSELCTYVDPDKSLAAPGNVVISEEGVLTFDAVEDAASYAIEFYIDGEIYCNTVSTYITVLEAEEGVQQYTFDLKAWMLETLYDDMMCNVYTVKVRAMSGDINVVKHGEASNASNEFMFADVQDKIEENLDAALESEDVSGARRALSQSSNEILVEMIQADADFAAKVAEADEAYKEEMNITVSAKSDVEAVDESKISIVGAALNAGGKDSKVELSVSTPDTEVTVPEAYENAVALDIQLLVDDEAMSELDVPVTITMPIPTGVSTENLVILHYHEEGKDPVVITPVVNADGTMTFIVTGFSTFVVANNDTTTPGGGDTEDGTDTPDDGTDTPEGGTDTPDGGTDTPEGGTDTPGTGTTPGTTPGTGTTPGATPATPAPGSGNSPKTGDAAGVATVCAIMVFAAAAVVVIRKRANVK